MVVRRLPVPFESVPVGSIPYGQCFEVYNNVCMRVYQPGHSPETKGHTLVCSLESGNVYSLNTEVHVLPISGSFQEERE